MAVPLVAGDTARADRAAASEEIRRALARELHDRVAQTLTTMLIELENFKVEQTGRQSALRQLDELQDSTRDVLANLRHVLFELRGESGTEDGLVEGVRALIGRFEERTHVKVELSISPSWPAHLRTQASMNMYRIVDEALTNARLHSGATMVEVALRLARDKHLAIEIKDDGRGADEELGRAAGMGVLGMRERVVILGGILEVDTGPGRGTTVRAMIPMEQVI